MQEKSLLVLDKLIIRVAVHQPHVFKTVLDKGEYHSDRGVHLTSKYDPLSTYYKSKIDVYLNKTYVAFFRCDKRTLENKGIVYIQIANPLFYFDCNYWFEVINNLMQTLDITFNGIHTLEIAYDSPNKLSRIKEWYNNSTLTGRNNYKPYGNKIIMNYSTDSQGDTGCMYIGGKRDKNDGLRDQVTTQIKIYEKVQEATTKGKKYIIEYFKLNGFDIEKGVDRVELYLKGYLLKGVITDLEQLTKQDVLFNIFKKYGQNYLKWYDLTKYTWVNRNRKYEILDLIDFSNTPYVPLFPNLASSTKRQGSFKSYKTMAKGLYSLYINTGDQYFMDALIGFLKRNSELKEWFIIKWEYFEIDYDQRCDDHVSVRILEIQERIKLL